MMLLTLAWMAGCTTCDATLLDGTAAGALAMCPLDGALGEWVASGAELPPAEVWAAVCPASVEGPRLEVRARVYSACGVGELGVSEHDFVYSEGRPLLAVAVAAELEGEIEDASIQQAARALVGTAPIDAVEPPAIQAPDLPDLDGEVVAMARDAKVGELPSVGTWRLAVVDSGERLALLELAEGPGESRVRVTPGGYQVWIDGALKPAVEGCPTLGPTLCSREVGPLVALLPEGPVQVVFEPTDSLQTLAELSTSIARPVVLGERYAGCERPADGMVCVPGGAATVGEGEHQREITVSTFYVDNQPVQTSRYQECSAEGFCPPRPRTGAVQTSLSFLDLEAFCTWEGKRVPFEWEWEKALRAGLIEGEGAEWTLSYARKKLDRCPLEECSGHDPYGPCGGGYPCIGSVEKVVRLAYEPGTRLFAHRSSRGDRGGRCASDVPWLATWPPEILVTPPAEPSALTPFDEDQRALVLGVAEDAIDEVPVCTDRMGLSTTECKDPLHHVVPNEERYHVLLDPLVNRGGGYLGVASDQNYTFAAVARSEVAWFMDYDAVIVQLHRVARAVFLKADTAEDFVAFYSPERAEQTLALLDETYAEDPGLEDYKTAFRAYRGQLFRHYTRELRPADGFEGRGWLRNAQDYAHIRDLWRMGRARAVKGNMLGDNAMLGIAEAAGKLGIPLRVYYTSNAPSAWGSEMTPSYTRNVLAFPFDEGSVVAQVFGFKSGYGQTGYWHYNVQDGLEAQRRLARGYDRLWQVAWPRLPSSDDDLTLCGLKGAAERQPVTRGYDPEEVHQ